MNCSGKYADAHKINGRMIKNIGVVFSALRNDITYNLLILAHHGKTLKETCDEVYSHPDYILSTNVFRYFHSNKKSNVNLIAIHKHNR